MARRPNYKFDRMERERAKASKKALRATAKAEKAKARAAGLTDSAESQGSPDPSGETETT